MPLQRNQLLNLRQKVHQLKAQKGQTRINGNLPSLLKNNINEKKKKARKSMQKQ